MCPKDRVWETLAYNTAFGLTSSLSWPIQHETWPRSSVISSDQLSIEQRFYMWPVWEWLAHFLQMEFVSLRISICLTLLSLRCVHDMTTFVFSPQICHIWRSESHLPWHHCHVAHVCNMASCGFICHAINAWGFAVWKCLKKKKKR